MSKRPSKPFVPKQTVIFKKPRLDINIISSQSARTDTSAGNGNCQISVQTTTRTRNEGSFIPNIKTSSSIQITTPPPRENEMDNMWDDDGDEFIVLASQAVEAEGLSQKLINASHLEVTYNRFATTSNVKSSTQRQQKFKCDTEDMFADLENLDKNYKEPERIIPIADKILASWATEPPYTEKLKKFSPNKPVPTSKFLSPESPKTNEPSTSRYNKYNLNSGKPSGKILNSLENTRKDNDKLKSECTDLCDKLQTKEGEVATLRYEINQLKIQNDSLRLEKLTENDNLKKEWVEKNKELEKTIKSQKSELEFKNVEILTLKSSKKFNDTQTMLNTTVNEGNIQINDLKLENSHLRDLVMNYMNGSSDIDVVGNEIQPIKLNIHFFYNPTNLAKSTVLRSQEEITLLNYLNYFQSLISKLVITTEEHSAIINYPEIDIIISKLLKYFLDYSKNLKFIKFTDNLQISNNAKFEYNFLVEGYKKFKFQNSKMDVYSNEPLIYHEKELIFRRTLSGISLLCKYSPEFAYNFLKSTNILQSFYHILEKISYSCDLYDHIGIITAISYILNSLIDHFENNEKFYDEFTDVVIKMFKLIVFCRPNVDCLIKLSSSLVKIKSTKFLALLCDRGESSNFVVNNTLKILQFSADSCILQIYSALLDVAIPQYEVLPNFQINALIKLTINTIIFFRYALQCKIHWTRQTANQHQTTASSVRVEKCDDLCNCYNRLCIATVTLLHLCLKHWIDNPKLIENRVISFLVKSGLLLLNEIFFLNYCKEVMLVGGFAISQRLQLIYDWIMEYKSWFSFKTAHEKVLKSMDMRYIISDPFKYKEEVNKPLKNLEIWNNVIDNFFNLEIN